MASLETQSPFFGSVPSGKPTSSALHLSLKEALEQGLRYNLGLLLDDQATRSERGARWKALSDLLPHLMARTTESVLQNDLAASGISFPGVPKIVGPFSVFDTRAFLSQPLLDFKAMATARAASQNIRAAEYSYKDARELVVLVVGNAYLLANADAARVEAAEAQVKTGQALYDKTHDMLKAGLVPIIDALRARVELETRQQELIVAQNNFAKQKLNLARAIGLSTQQEFILTDKTPYKVFQPASFEQDLARAYATRADYQSALAEVRAAELRRQAAGDERLPSISFNADYGDIGLRPTSSHGTVTLTGTLKIPIFQGGKVKGDVLQADALLKQREVELADLRERIAYQVRTALLDLKAASDQVQVARSSLSLANQTLAQAEDRFAAGVVDNLEVVQAQEAVATANEAYITSLYEHNVAKVNLARAVGIAEQAVMQYLGGK